MQTTTKHKILNYIIAISLIGILLISLKDYFFSAKTAGKLLVKNPIVATPTIQDTDPKIPCESQYFDLKKGAVRRYKISTWVETKEAKEASESFFTTRVIETSPSSIVMTTQFNGQKEIIKTQLICKKSGIYGFPLPFMTNLDLSSVFASIRFLPPNQDLKQGQNWQSIINLSSVVGIDLPATSPIFLRNRVVDEKNQTLTVVSDLVFAEATLKSFNDLTDEILQYDLKKGVGIVNMTVDVHLEDLGRWRGVIELTDSQTKE